jgi:hypothetical protein
MDLELFEPDVVTGWFVVDIFANFTCLVASTVLVDGADEEFAGLLGVDDAEFPSGGALRCSDSCGGVSHVDEVLMLCIKKEPPYGDSMG